MALAFVNKKIATKPVKCNYCPVAANVHCHISDPTQSESLVCSVCTVDWYALQRDILYSDFNLQ